MNSPADLRSVDPQLAALKVPPHSVEAEQSVLGGLMLDNGAWDKVGDLIREDDFYRFDHRLIWQHIAKLIEKSRPADVITVYESLQIAGRADEAGGLAYLNALATSVPSAANVRRYAEIVRDRAVLRKLVTVAEDIAGAAYNPQGKDTKQLLDEAESRVFAIAEEGARGAAGFHNLPDVLTEVVERIDELYHRNDASDITGTPSGFDDMDKM
ncbi:MAG TPA: DnaB-like helicase N-terminal domain-containing protein, partial [Burkholderiaceae bacterium]|nr:DnaB-like helicase N-terminal domain-containing protein [Burkholderiaceae bacterium]